MQRPSGPITFTFLPIMMRLGLTIACLGCLTTRTSCWIVRPTSLAVNVVIPGYGIVLSRISFPTGDRRDGGGEM